MTKKGPLSKAEEFYIKHHYKASDVDSLSKELNRAKSLVESCVRKCKKEDEKNEVFSVANQMATRKGSVVMTEGAAILADTIKRGLPSKPSNCVTRIK